MQTIAGGTAMKHLSRGQKSSSGLSISFETRRVSDLRPCGSPVAGSKGMKNEHRSWTLTLSLFANGGIASLRLLNSIFRYITGSLFP
jgi:hypothetical protein